MLLQHSPKIVVVTESTLGQWFDGVSLIVRHFIRHLPENIVCEIWSLGEPGDAPQLNPRCSFHTLDVPKIRRMSWLLRVLGIPTGVRKAADSNKYLQIACDNADAILVFSSAQSPVTSWIAGAWAGKTLLHLTDCSSLHAKRFGNRKHYLRHRLVEWRTGKADLAGIAFVSPFDTDVFRTTSRAKSPVITLPLGVDIQQFRPRDTTEPDQDRPFTILFTGVLSYYPNAQAALFIARELLPLLPPETRVIIAGMEPAEELHSFAAKDPRLVITGALAAIEEIYGDADIFIAPMFEGAGMQNKILQALASGLPVVTTPICAAAFSALPEAILVCADASSMLDSIMEFQNDESQRHKLAVAARRYAVDQLSWANRTAALLEYAGVSTRGAMGQP